MNSGETRTISWLKKIGRIENKNDVEYRANARPRLKTKNGDYYEAKILYGGNKIVFYESEFDQFEKFPGNGCLSIVIFDQFGKNNDPLTIIPFPKLIFGQRSYAGYSIEWVKKETKKAMKLDPHLEHESLKYLETSGFTDHQHLSNELLRRWLSDLKDKEEAAKGARMSVSSNTLRNLLPEWARNLRFNAPKVTTEKDITELSTEFNGRKISICVGAGPSLKKYDHLKKLKEFQKKFDGLVLACDRSLPMCLEAGVIPDIVSSLDGDPSIKKYFDSELVRKHSKDIKGVFSVTCHPDVIDSWKGDAYYYTPYLDNPLELDSISRFIKVMTGKTVMNHGGNVGMFNWYMSITPLYCNPVVLLGVDLSWPMPIDIRETDSFGIYSRAYGGDMEKIDACYRRDYNPDFKNECLVDQVMDEYIRSAQTWIPGVYAAHGVITINCTGGGALHTIDGVTSIQFEDFIAKYNSGEFKKFMAATGAIKFDNDSYYEGLENKKSEKTDSLKNNIVEVEKKNVQ